jgi:hypothetical protein
MNVYKKFSFIIAAIVIFNLALAGGASAKQDSKVDVCHKTGNDSFHLISISSSALDAHLAHGDGMPGQAVPGQPGKVFGADCSIAPTGQSEPAQPPPLTTPPNTKKTVKPNKVDVCHKTGNGNYILINISRNALPAHIQNHGDGYPNDWIPNQPGKKFDSNCAVIEVPQQELVQTLTVLPTGESFTSWNLVPGQLYVIKVSGTYTYNNIEGDWADAEYFLQLGDIIKGDDEYPDFRNILDLSINGITTNQDWGAYQPTHVYTKDWTGTGDPLSFAIYDTYFDDNSGFLTVEIWKINW